MGNIVIKEYADGTIMVTEADVVQLLEEKDVDSIIKVLRHGGTRSMQMDAAIALGRIGDPKAVETLIWALGMSSLWPDTRVYAAQSLGSIGGNLAGEAILAATKDREKEVRETAKSMLKMYFSELIPEEPEKPESKEVKQEEQIQSKKWWKFWK